MNTRGMLAVLTLAVGLMGADVNDWYATRVQSVDYPLLGLQARESGIVRLRAHVDDAGVVTEVSVISGNSLLARTAAENLKRWRFARHSTSSGAQSGRVAGDVEVTYDFRLVGETNSTPKSEFVYEYPNRVTLTSAAPRWMPEH